LMEPYGMTELDMDISKILFGFSVIIKNVGETSIVKSGLIFIFGFGPIEITVTAWADNAPEVTKTLNGFVVLIFIIIK